MSDIESKRAQLALKKFQAVAELHLDILKRRKDAMKKARLASDHRSMLLEKKRADIVVKQLYDDVQQMFNWCSDLHGDTLEWVQAHVRPLNSRIQSALSDFINECESVSDQCDQDSIEKSPVTKTGTTLANVWTNEESSGSNDHSENCKRQKTLLLADTLEQRQCEYEAHQQLLSDILELNEIMKHMDGMVREQGESVESIENNVDKTFSNIEAGKKSLGKAVKMKAAKYPLTGALIGAGAAAGPVGLLVGLKLGVLAAIGGSAVGALSGHFLRTKVTNETCSSSTQHMPAVSSSTSKLARNGKKEE